MNAKEVEKLEQQFKALAKEMVRAYITKGLIIIEDVVDVIVEENALIGVGLISLGDHLKEYCYNKA